MVLDIMIFGLRTSSPLYHLADYGNTVTDLWKYINTCNMAFERSEVVKSRVKTEVSRNCRGCLLSRLCFTCVRKVHGKKVP